MSEVENQDGEVKLYAGKFKTVEDMESAYKSAEKLIGVNSDLSRRLDEITTVPEDYVVSDDLGLAAADLNDLKAVARKAGLSQKHFEKLASEYVNTAISRSERKEALKKEVDASTESLLKDYVGKNYPTELGEYMLDKLMTDKAARDAALAHRSKTLNSAIPGIDKVGNNPPPTITQKEVLVARAAWAKNPRDLAAKQNYLDMLKKKAG